MIAAWILARGPPCQRHERPCHAHAEKGVPRNGRRIAAQFLRIPTTRPSRTSAPAFTEQANEIRKCSCCARPRTRCCRYARPHKWFDTREDLDYTTLWILYAATPLAQVEVLSAGQRGRSESSGR